MWPWAFGQLSKKCEAFRLLSLSAKEPRALSGWQWVAGVAVFTEMRVGSPGNTGMASIRYEKSLFFLPPRFWDVWLRAGTSGPEVFWAARDRL
jgi:hypothetical protein